MNIDTIRQELTAMLSDIPYPDDLNVTSVAVEPIGDRRLLVTWTGKIRGTRKRGDVPILLEIVEADIPLDIDDAYQAKASLQADT